MRIAIKFVVLVLTICICICTCQIRTSISSGPGDPIDSPVSGVVAVTVTPLFDDYWYRFDTKDFQDPESVESLAKLIAKGAIHKPAQKGFHEATIEYESGKKTSYYFLLSDGKGGAESSEAIVQSHVFFNEIFPKVQKLVIDHLEARKLKPGAEPD